MIGWQPHGIVVPLVTPIANGSVDVDSLERLVESVIEHVDALLVLGTTGEQVLLTADQARLVVEATIQCAAGRRPVMVGIAAPGTRRAVDDIDRLAGSAAGVLVTPGFYFAMSPDDQRRHFETVAEASPVPVVIYNIPQHTGRPVPPGVVADLATHPNVAGIKDSSGDLIAFQDFRRLCPDGFPVLQGREQLAAPSAAAGGAGLVSALANLLPETLRTLHEMAARESARARPLQDAVTTLADVFDGRDFIAVLKSILVARGILSTPELARPWGRLSSVASTRALTEWDAARDQLDGVLSSFGADGAVVSVH
jgi:4-hydroxy-tetrahydrodipicolinate synthase